MTGGRGGTHKTCFRDLSIADGDIAMRAVMEGRKDAKYLHILSAYVINQPTRGSESFQWQQLVFSCITALLIRKVCTNIVLDIRVRVQAMWEVRWTELQWARFLPTTSVFFPGGKDGRCVGLTTLPPSCADCLEILKPQPPEIPRACPGL
jgi:hypothetical protein